MANLDEITSRDNRRLVHARKVRDGKIDGEIFIEGKRLVQEALASKVRLIQLFVTPEAAGNLPLPVRDKALRVSHDLIASISDTPHPQGIVAIGERPKTDAGRIEGNIRTADVPIVLVLNEINNPSNLGAAVRSAEAAGTVGVVVTRNSADPFSPKALRASMGSAFRLPIWLGCKLEEVIGWAREHGLSVAAADVTGKIGHDQLDWRTPRALILGSEGHGLSGEVLGSVDETLQIEMAQPVESLNLAVSAGVILFEARRQNKVR
jgi:RNA methyltransferase, TrmH family